MKRASGPFQVLKKKGRKMKAHRNKTIDLTVEEGKEYLEKCLSLKGSAAEDQITDTVIRGDLFETAPFLPDGFADLVIADPPYNLNKTFSSARFSIMDDGEYEAYTESWVKLVKPLMKDTASIYVCCDWKCSSAVYTVLKRYFKIRNRITWQREKGRGAKSNWKNSMEDIWFATVSDDYVFNIDDVKIRRKVIAPYRENGRPKDWVDSPEGKYRDTHPSNFWDDITVPYWSMKENTLHPTQKPEKLLAKLILASSSPGDIVFDPFLGSGSTAVTAKKLGRFFAGVEKEEQYCVWAQKRLELAEEDSSIQGYSGGIFWERNSKP